MSGLTEPSVPQRRILHKAPGPCLSPSSEHVARLLDGGDDAADVLDRALDEEVDARRLAAHAADVGEEPDDALLRRIRLHQRMEHPDLARGAVVHRRAVEDRKQRVGAFDPRPVLREDPRRGDVETRRELVLVRNEDLEAVGTQRGGAFVDERTFVRREERAGEVDLQEADATESSAGRRVTLRMLCAAS